MATNEDHHIAMFTQEKEQKSTVAQLEDSYSLRQELTKAKEGIDSLHSKNTALEKEIVRLKEQLELAKLLLKAV